MSSNACSMRSDAASLSVQSDTDRPYAQNMTRDGERERVTLSPSPPLHTASPVLIPTSSVHRCPTRDTTSATRLPWRQ